MADTDGIMYKKEADHEEECESSVVFPGLQSYNI